MGPMPGVGGSQPTSPHSGIWSFGKDTVSATPVPPSGEDGRRGARRARRGNSSNKSGEVESACRPDAGLLFGALLGYPARPFPWPLARCASTWLITWRPLFAIAGDVPASVLRMAGMVGVLQACSGRAQGGGAVTARAWSTHNAARKGGPGRLGPVISTWACTDLGASLP